MKKIILSMAIAMSCYYSYAQQWNLSGTNIYNSNTGNVGIGTSSPVDKLEVSNGFITSGYVSIGSNFNTGPHNFINYGSDQHGSLLMGSNIYVTSASGTTALKIANTHNSMAGAGIFIPGNGQNYQSSIMFHTTVPASVTANSPFSSCRMIITEHGNVGIGTLSPDQLLTINGTVHSKEIKVDNNIPVPDYVFDKSYKPVDLSALKDYVALNHHLPEIPSAVEIEKNGLNLGEMNLKLLKKVEELTLYAIEQQKKIDQLEEQQQQKTNDQEARIAALERALLKLISNQSK